MYIQAVFLIVTLVLSVVDCAVRIDAAQRVRTRRSELMAKRSLNDPPPDLKQLLHLSPKEDIKKQWTMEIVGGNKTRYVETYRGIPIYDSIVTSDDKDSDVSGTLFQDIDKDIVSVKPKLSSDQALKLFIKHNNHTKYTISSSKVVLYVHAEHNKKARLIYEIVYMAESNDTTGPQIPMCLMDANTGDIFKQWDNAESYYGMEGYGGNIKTGRYRYGTKYGKLMVTKSGTSCIMENDNVTVIHYRKSSYYAYNLGHCNGANDSANGAYSPANDAFYFGNIVHDMYMNWYGLPPLKYQKIKLRVHYGGCYDNAFWSGGYVYFGDGCTKFYPLVGPDIVAHEISHGFTQQNSQLVYSKMSGGINEAFSDMAGEAAEFFLKGSNDWKVGYEITKVGSLRYMDNPTKDNVSIDHVDDYYGQNVHYTSGIFNKAFYLLCDKYSWNIKQAFHIFLVANRMYWFQDTTFNEGACGCIKAAKDFGYNTSEVIAAFEAVGVQCKKSISYVEIENGKAVMDLSGSSGDTYYFVLNKRTCGGYLEIKTSGGYVSRYLRMYIKKGYPPTARSYDYLYSAYYNSRLSYRINGAGCGKYYVMLRCTNYFSNVVLVAKYLEAGCDTENLCPGHLKTGMSAGKDSLIYYKIVTSYGCNMTVKAHGGQGDLDIYLKKYSKPSLTGFDTASLRPCNDEEVKFTASTTNYYILVHAYQCFGGANLSIQGHCFGPQPEPENEKRSFKLDEEKQRVQRFKLENHFKKQSTEKKDF